MERQEERAIVRRDALTMAGYRCQMVEAVPEVRCSTYSTFTGDGLDVDEIQGRGVRPGSQYEPSLVQVACRAHHRWKTENPKLASERGLTVRSTFEAEGLARRLR